MREEMTKFINDKVVRKASLESRKKDRINV